MARLAQAPADSASMRGERRYDGKARKAEQDQQAQTKASCVLHCRALGSRAVAASRPQVLFPCQPSPASALNMALNVLAPEWCPSPPTAPFRLSPTAKVWTQVPLSPTIRCLWTAPAKQAAPAKPRSNTTMVETVAGLKSMLEAVKTVQQLAVDCEGVDLSRDGKLCVLILAAQGTSGGPRVWLVDVHTLGAAAFTTPSDESKNAVTLKGLLESPHIRKLMFDPRQDSNALWHQYGVLLENVLCLQVAEVAYRQYVKGQTDVKHVRGLGKCYEIYLPPKLTSDSQIDKRVMRKLFEDDPELWTRRPLSDQLVRYCTQDVSPLFMLRTLLTAGLSPEVLQRVQERSSERVNECLQAEETDHALRVCAPKV